MAGRIKVLIVDDSAYMRVVLKDMLESDSNVSVVGVAKDGVECMEKTKLLSPDVVLLDIQMPRMDGVATLQRIMKECPTRVIMLSAMDKMDEQLPLRALELGAVDFISKPSGPVSIDILGYREKIIEIVKTSSNASVDVLRRARAPLPNKIKAPKKEQPDGLKAIVLGASTGGPKALEVIFATLPRELPAPFFIVQHIPGEFSEVFARRLDSAQGPKVVVATENRRVERGVAYLAPGGKHLKLGWRGATSLVTKLDDGDPVNFVKPSADVLFASAAACLGKRVLAIVLTGMGRDGTEGARAIVAAGGRVIVQDEQSCVASGMPGSVCEAGAATKVLPLEDIPKEIVRFLEE